MTVCLSVCVVISQSSVKTAEQIGLVFLLWELFSTYPTLYFMEIWVPTRVLPPGTFS